MDGCMAGAFADVKIRSPSGIWTTHDEILFVQVQERFAAARQPCSEERPGGSELLQVHLHPRPVVRWLLASWGEQMEVGSAHRRTL